MQLKLEVITPKIASELLGDNENNRTPNPSHVKFLADQITEGAWQETGDPIKVGTTGRLLDGQHRLSAVIKSGKAIGIWVARDVPEEVFTVLDTGKVRTGRDTLSIMGLKSPTAQCALARAIMAYDEGRITSKSRTFTNQETLQYCQDNDLLPFINVAATYAQSGAPVKIGIISIVHFLLARIDKQQADQFMESLCLGVDVKKGTPVYIMREKLNKAIIGKYGYSKWETVAMIIKTWNLIRNNSEVPTMIVYRPDKEDFPIAV